MDKLPDAGYLLNQLLDTHLDVIYFKDTQSRLTMFNKAYASKHGWTSLEDGLGKSDFDLFSEEHARQACADEQRILKTGIPLVGVEEKETWSDGRVTWCSSTKVPLRDDDGAIVGIFGITRDITANKETELRSQRYADQIRRIKDTLEEDARMAGKLQRSFFMTEYPVYPDGAEPQDSCIEFLHHFNKCSLVSGDYCCVKRLSDHQVAILLCDVLGTGVRAALGASLIRGIMQDLSPLVLDPSAYLGRLNEQLYPLLHAERLLLDVTACYLVLDVSSGVAEVASAGHPLPLHFRKEQPVKWLFENLVLRGPALAAEPHAKYQTVTCRLQPDDSVVLFTDGLFSVENSMREPFCEKRLLDTAQGLAGKTLGRIFSGLENAAVAFSKDDHFTDDVCLIGFHLRRLMEAL